MQLQKKQKQAFLLWANVIKERGLKQTWVADKAGISTPHLSNILAGRVLITNEVKERINSALGTSFE